MKIEGTIFDVVHRRKYDGEITIINGFISGIEEKPIKENRLILPGLIDSHIHIESSMLVPSEFAKAALSHGTVAVVSDPHEIANVMGLRGIEYMLENASHSPMKFYFGAPSCVPATSFETSGAVLNPEDIKHLLADDRIHYLSEMMNFPGVIFGSEDVHAKIRTALSLNKPVDGHAPALTGEELKIYVQSGISTDHESTTLEEALEKINLGMKILIRNGSAAKNFDALHSLIKTHNQMVMLCSDDLHPDDLLKGHINLLVKKSIDLGYDLFDVLTACTVNPIRHYNLDIGLLQINSPADFIIIDNLSEFNIQNTFIDGREVFSSLKTTETKTEIKPINNFNTEEKLPSDFDVPFSGGKIRVIEIIPGEIVTGDIQLNPNVFGGYIQTDINRDILKITVVNRYADSKPAVAFVKNFGIKSGAVASSIAHDSHNIVCIATNDDDMTEAVNEVIRNKGGIAVSVNKVVTSMKLPVAGLMSDRPCLEVAEQYSKLTRLIKEMGSKLDSPLMTLSFMALIVIPKLKLSDKGLFDVSEFRFVEN